MHGQLAREFAEKARHLHDCTTDLVETMDLVLDLACHTLACRHAGLVLVHGEKRLDHSLPEESADEQLQIDLDGGPCLAAIFDDAILRIDDTFSERRWPAWTAHVAALGVRSVLSVPVGLSTEPIGSLSLYDPAPHRFTGDEAAMATVLAHHAAVALAGQVAKVEETQRTEAPTHRPARNARSRQRTTV